jgi:hypothetical protein
MNKDNELLTEAYLNTNTKPVLLSPNRVKYILFPEEYEMYSLDPYKQVVLKDAFRDKEVSKWIPRDVVIGEDLQDLGLNVSGIQTTSWYVAGPAVPADHLHRALVGYR